MGRPYRYGWPRYGGSVRKGEKISFSLRNDVANQITAPTVRRNQMGHVRQRQFASTIFFEKEKNHQRRSVASNFAGGRGRQSGHHQLTRHPSMANPRRGIALQIHTQAPPLPTAAASSSSSLPSLLLHFLKRPASFPFLLSLFVLLTWIFLRFHQPTPSASLRRPTVARDPEANLVRYPADLHPTPIAADGRGWLLDPVAGAHDAGLLGGALVCLSLHVGLIQPGGLRGNHRHHTCNETFVIWGAKTKFRLENADVKDKGYGEAIIAADEVAIVASARSTAHALINMDAGPTFFVGCQDTPIYPNSSNTDYKVWKDL